jgi:hypothetical protein
MANHIQEPTMHSKAMMEAFEETKSPKLADWSSTRSALKRICEQL